MCISYGIYILVASGSHSLLKASLTFIYKQYPVNNCNFHSITTPLLWSRRWIKSFWCLCGGSHFQMSFYWKIIFDTNFTKLCNLLLKFQLAKGRSWYSGMRCMSFCIRRHLFGYWLDNDMGTGHNFYQEWYRFRSQRIRNHFILIYKATFLVGAKLIMQKVYGNAWILACMATLRGHREILISKASFLLGAELLTLIYYPEWQAPGFELWFTGNVFPY